MTAKELIENYRSNPDRPNNELIGLFAYNPQLSVDQKLIDCNLEFRTEIVELLLSDFDKIDIHLIRILFDEEIKCELATQRHDNLYQLCFYLFILGDLQDSFVVYDAKFNAKSMDVGCSLDREMISVGHEIEEVIKYVKNEFKKDSRLEPKYSGILDELQGLKDVPDYDSIQAYTKFIKGYFYGHDKFEND